MKHFWSVWDKILYFMVDNDLVGLNPETLKQDVLHRNIQDFTILPGGILAILEKSGQLRFPNTLLPALPEHKLGACCLTTTRFDRTDVVLAAGEKIFIINPRRSEPLVIEPAKLCKNWHEDLIIDCVSIEDRESHRVRMLTKRGRLFSFDFYSDDGLFSQIQKKVKAIYHLQDDYNKNVILNLHTKLIRLDEDDETHDLQVCMKPEDIRGVSSDYFATDGRKICKITSKDYEEQSPPVENLPQGTLKMLFRSEKDLILLFEGDSVKKVRLHKSHSADGIDTYRARAI